MSSCRRALYGRDAERALIAELVAGASAGRGGALVIRGEPGIGKSALLDEAAARAREGDQPVRVLRVAGVESEAELPFAGLHLLVRSALGRLDALPPVQAAALRGAFGLAAGAVADPFLVGLAVLSLLAEVAEDGPLLCLLDDAQWLDGPSAQALLFAARRLDAEPVAMIFAARPGPSFPAAGTRELALGPLDRPSAARLLDQRDPGLARGRRRLLLDRAAGNPLALVELPIAVEGAGADGTPAGEIRLTDRLQAAFGARAHRLPGPSRVLLSVVSAEDTGDLAVILRAAAALGAGLGDLAPAEESGLITVAEGAVAFRHPLARAAVYQAMTTAARVAAHRALADAWAGGVPGDGAPGDGASADVDRRAWHLAAATTGVDETVAAALEDGAERAGGRGGHLAAATTYERAARLSPDPADRTRRLILAAAAAAEAGEPDRSRALAAAVVSPPPAGPLRSRLTMVDALSRFWRGERAAAHRLLLDAVDTAEPAQRLELAIEATYVGWFTGAGELAASLDRLVPAVGPPPSGQPLADLVVGGLSAVVGRTAPESPATLLARAIPAVKGSPSEQLLAAGVALAAGQDRDVADLAASALADARAQGRIGWVPNLLFVLAEAEIFLGRHRDGPRAADEGTQIAEAIGQGRQWRGQAASLAAYVAAIEGDETRCRAAADAVLTDRTGPGVDRSTWALGLLDLGAGRAREALDRLTSLADGANWYGLSGTRCVPDLVEASARVGEPERATPAFERFAAWADRVGQPWADALASRCRALRATASGGAEDFYLAALAAHQKDFRPLDAARTELLYGEWLRRARRKADAGPRLRAAAQTFERLGARPWAARATGELAATGLARDRTTPAARNADSAPGDVQSGVGAPTVAGAPDLTPREAQIVALAARGLSNRDIAAQLFLSPRTVGHHLYKAYPKLGVESRSQLRRPSASRGAW